ncbi:Ig-like domain-containing protein [Pseudomonas sp. D47]|uniref:Ig-like domain-containing protein n=1 Tax=Pseudomonas sp. D47 TaxID=3159447 RepID=UPI00387B0278
MDNTAPTKPADPLVTTKPDGIISISGGADAAEPGSVIHVIFPDGTSGTTTVRTDGSYGPITSNTPQPNGDVRVVATDLAGNESLPASTPYIDDTAPTTPAAPTVLTQTDGTVSISGTAEPGTTLTAMFPDGTIGTVLVDEHGNYGPLTSAAPQPTGMIILSVTDVAGNHSDSIDTPYIDSTPPSPDETLTIERVTPDSATSVAGSDADFITNIDQLVFDGNLIMKLAFGESVEVRFDNDTTWRAAVITDTTWSFDNRGNNPLSEGAHTVHARIVDAAGNVGYSLSRDLMIDTQGPSATEILSIERITPDTTSSVDGSEKDFITSELKLSFSGSLLAPLQGNNVVQFSFDDGSNWHTATTSGTSWTYNDAPEFMPNSTFYVQARIIDEAGNPGQSVRQQIVIDRQAPLSGESITFDSISDDTGTLGDFVTSNNDQIFRGSLGAALMPDEHVEINLGSGWVTATHSDTEWSYDAPPLVSDGVYTVRVRVVDAAGNVGQFATGLMTLDTSLPTATTTPAFTAITFDSGLDGQDYITNDNTLGFSGTLTAPLQANEKLQFRFDGSSWFDVVSVNETGWTFSYLNVELGDKVGYEAQVRLITIAGRVGATVTQLVTVDHTLPSATAEVTSISIDTGSSATDFVTSEKSLVFSITLNGVLESNEFVQISMNGSTWKTATQVAGNIYQYEGSELELPANQSITIFARVTDQAGNFSTMSSHGLTIDTLAPSADNSISISGYSDDVPLLMGTFTDGSLTNDTSPLLKGLVSGLLIGDVVQVYEGAAFLGEAAVSFGTWSYQLSGKTDGDYTYHVVIVDSAGNLGTASADFHLTIDTQGPSFSKTVEITTLTTDLGLTTDFNTHDNTPIISGTLSAPLVSGESVLIHLGSGARVDAAVDGTTWSYASGLIFDGSYTITVEVVDAAGNVGHTSTKELLVDTSAPDANNLISISGISRDTGISGSDFKTNRTPEQFLGDIVHTLDTGERVEIKLINNTDGETTSWLTATTINTSWVYHNEVDPFILTDGEYTIMARVIDSAGNVGQSISHDMTIDSSAPTGNTIEITTISPDNGSSDTDYKTNQGRLIFNGTIETVLLDGQTVEIRFNDRQDPSYEPPWVKADVNLKTWTYDNRGTELREGVLEVEARIVDEFGNVEQTAKEPMLIDLSVPSASVAITAINNDSPGDFITSEQRVVFRGTVGAALGSDEEVQIRIDNGIWKRASVASTDWSFNNADDLANGLHTVDVRIVDTAGNIGLSDQKVVTIDITAPTATAAISRISDDSGIAGDFTTSDQNLTVNATLIGTLSAGEKVQISLDNGTTWHDTTLDGDGTYAYDNTALALAEGPHAFIARVVDLAGNATTGASQAVVIDITGPILGYSVGINSYTDNVALLQGNFSNNTSTNDNTPMLNGSVTGLVSGDTLQVYEGLIRLGEATLNGGNWSYQLGGIDGAHSYRVVVTDRAGNLGLSSSPFTLTVDSTPPSATITSIAISHDSGELIGFTTKYNTLLTLSGGLSSPLSSGEVVMISLDNGVTYVQAASTSNSWSYYSGTVPIPDTSSFIKVRVVDQAGNTGTSVTQPFIIDTGVPLALASFTSITDDTGTSGTDLITRDPRLIFSGTYDNTLLAGENVQISINNGIWMNASVSTNPNTWSVNYTAVPLGDGTYTVQARVIDAAGNVTLGNTNTVFIDTTAPVMTAVALTAITTDTSPGLVGGAGSNTNSALDTNLYTRDPLLTVSGTYVGTLNPGELKISSDGGLTWINVSSFNNATHTWSYTDPVVRTGLTTYQLRAIDTAGNLASATASLAVTVDTSAPSTAALMAPVVAAAYDTGVLGDNITTTAAIVFASGASVTESGVQIALVNDINNNGVYEEGLDYILSAAVVSANGSWSVTTGALAVGGYHLGYMLVDQAGNRSNLTATTHLRVVSSDLASVALSGNYNAGSNSIKLGYDGLWHTVVTSGGAYYIYAQQALSSVSFVSQTQTFNSFNSFAHADFTRAGHAGLASIGTSPGNAIFMLTTTDDVTYTQVTLGGNARTNGGVVAYDKTGDGYLDFAFGDSANTSLSFVTNSSGALAWMNGTATTGSGRPSGAGPIATINNYAEASAVDLDNNGTVDIAEHTNALGPYTLTLFKNNQLSTSDFVLVSVAGVFSTPDFKVPIAMTWGDFNNDGFMDLYLNAGLNAVANNDVSSSRIYWNNHSGGFGTTAGTTGGTATYFSDAIYGSGSLAIDWNHDGKMDVVEVPANGVSGTIVWYQNEGDGVFRTGLAISGLVRSDLIGVTSWDLNWDGAPDLMVNIVANIPSNTLFNNILVADGASLHLQIFDKNGLNVFYANTVQLYDHLGALVSSQIINPQMGLTSNDASALVYFYGLSATETYTAVLLNSVGGVSTDTSGLTTLNGNNIEQVNATWTGLTAGLATHNYVLSAEAGANNANGNFIGTGYNDTFFATAGTDTYNGGAGWVTHYGTPAWSITGGEDIVDFTLAGNTSITVNLNSTLAQNTGFNTVTLSNIEGLVGGAGNDNFIANSTAGVNSLLDGRGGNDTYTITGGGHTLLTFTNVNNNDATGGNGSDTAIGFGLGNTTSVAAADVIDMSALLQGYTGTAYVYHDTTTNKDVLDKASEGLMNYLSVTNDGTNTQITVDRDGTGSTFAPTLVLTLNNVTTDMETLLVNHQLIV